MAAHPYRFTVQTTAGRDVLVYEGTVQRVGQVRVTTDGTTVSLVYRGQEADDLEDRAVAPLVLATAPDPGGELELRRVALKRQGKGQPVTKPVRR